MEKIESRCSSSVEIASLLKPRRVRPRRAGIDFLAVHDAGLHWTLRYRGRAWNNVEPEVQRDWTQRYLANPLGPSERVRARLLGEYDRR